MYFFKYGDSLLQLVRWRTSVDSRSIQNDQALPTMHRQFGWSSEIYFRINSTEIRADKAGQG